MKNSWHSISAVLCAAGLSAAMSIAQAGTEGPLLPPGAPLPEPTPISKGADLQQQVDQGLKADFDAADVDKKGVLTKEQAQKAGLGFVSNNFSKIDTAKRGKVTFEDVKRYIQMQR
ncbi:EF-hand domain-containing protein [Collimonas humicola]|uniref:EF-hand domain-containing protein n=1 Tax=Collimonas humicola TaxID=2825886 RepID=UPI001B8C7833|nr:EF-hand domain-containing protein [Collimonas humicola]